MSEGLLHCRLESLTDEFESQDFQHPLQYP